MRPLRILHIGKYYPPVPGGMERFLGDLVEAQRAAGHDVTVLVHAEPRSDRSQDPPWLLRCPVWLRLIFAPVSPQFFWWLRRIVRRFRPDVIHIHMPNLSAFWALLVPSARRVPWVIHWQSDVVPSARKLALRLAYPHYRIFERAMLERADAIVVSSPQYLEASRALAPWRDKCHVIPLGIDPARLPDVDLAGTEGLWRGGGLRVLSAGRLTYYKGFETLIRAVAGTEGIELVIVGEGEERGSLTRELRAAGRPESIRLEGRVDDATLCRMMASCDVFCLPSLERTESFGIVLVEAMRYSKPLVVSDLGDSGITYVARAGQNGLHFRSENAGELRSTLLRLAERPDERHLLGRLGHERFLREFTIAAVERRIDALYRLLMRMRMEDAAARSAPGDPFAPDTAAVEPEAAQALPPDRLLIVIPALNEADCIGEVIEQARSFGGVDVLVVDDGSTDDTAAVAMLAGARVLRAPLWQGAWGAMQTGIRYAVRHGYTAVVTMDADGQHEPSYLPQLIEAGRGADVVIAACPSRGSRMRHVAWAYFRFLTGLRFDDLTSGFRLYNSRACRLLAMEEATLLDYQDLGVLLLLRRAGLDIAEISVSMNARRSGASRVFSSWWTVGRYMLETTLLCLARWNFRARK
jgi:glycosyltransferase involved in cell wall biosynthesis